MGAQLQVDRRVQERLPVAVHLRHDGRHVLQVALGFYIGRDKFGSNVLVDFNRRADDKTNANILILGNSGQGKSYLLKLLLPP